MRLFALFIAAFSALAVLLSLTGSAASIPLYVALAGFVMAGLLVLSERISSFLRIFVVMYGFGYLLIAGAALAGSAGLLPGEIAPLVPPAFTAVAAVVFGLVVFGASFLPVIRTITSVADPYFQSADPAKAAGLPFGGFASEEGKVGARLVALLIAINFIQVAIQIRLNLFSRDLFNALEQKNGDAFWFQLFGVFAPLATVWIAVAIYEVYVDSSLAIRWRNWMTRQTFGRWLDHGTHYRMSLQAQATDNPDQRIQADVRGFIDTTMILSIRLLSQAATLVSFLVILWNLSRDFTIPFVPFQVPGMLVWFALTYAIVGTWLTHVIGKPLIQLDFKQEQVEANFRFSLARLREYTEQIALLKGERAERQRLEGSFGDIIANFLKILSRRMKLTTFTAGYGQLSAVFPYALAAPSYFAGRISLGQFQQVAGAFAQVTSALSFFINSYTTLAAYKAIIDRLTTFRDAMQVAEAQRAQQAIAVAEDGADALSVTDLALALPDGRALLTVPQLAFRRGETALVSGPSGSGKSTLFRALAGIWPFGTGTVAVPKGADVMLLPQRPYLPLGSLRGAVVYPATEGSYADPEIVQALELARLPGLVGRLDETANWSQVLSGGEQQRVAIARALLEKPAWLFLDEATASLDETLEGEIYRMLAERLPDTTIVSIGHRSTLHPLHDRRIEMRPDGGAFRPEAVAA